MIDVISTLLGKVLFVKEWNYVQQVIEKEVELIKKEPNFVSPLILQQVLISGEDHRFFRHKGYDKIAICRVIWKGVTKGMREGGSTIEQQLVRIITGDRRHSMKRKIKEISLAILLSRKYPKIILPSIYLNLAYFGWRMNGISQACKRLDISLQKITLYEAASIVARLKYPEPRSCPLRRKCQIDTRINYLIYLYNKHLKKGYYEGFGINSINRAIFVRLGVSISR
jgi:penicillin-binding protein 1A